MAVVTMAANVMVKMKMMMAKDEDDDGDHDVSNVGCDDG